MQSIKVELCCKLCRGIICSANCQVIDSEERVALNDLNLNLDIAETDVICSGCSENLLAAFNFKVMCLETEDNITPYVHSAEDLVDIKEIYVKVKDDKKLIDMLEDTKICRLCLQLVNCEFKSINEVYLDTVREYIPEINFVAVDDPILCKICFDSLHNHSIFLKNCLGKKENTQLRSNQRDIKAEECQINSEEFKIKSEEFVIKCEEDEQRIPEDSVLISKRTKSKFNNNESICDEKIKKTTNNHKKECRVFCDQCSYRTTHKYKLNQHKLVHTKEKPYICGECGFRSARKDNLNDHVKRHVTTPNTENSSSELFKCHDCNFISKHRSALTRHKRIHTGEKLKIYKCDKCPFQTVYKQNLISHNIRHIKPEEAQLYYCALCDFCTRKKSYLPQHMMSHRNQSEVEFFKCDKCDFRTVRKSKLREHVVRHSDTFKCELCSYKSPYKHRMSRHFERIHEARSIKLMSPERRSTV